MSDIAHPLERQYLLGLLDLVAVTNGAILTETFPAGPAEKLQKRMRDHGLLRPESSVGELCAVLEDLGQHLHYALGAYDEPPPPKRRMTTFVLTFPSRAACEACAPLVAALGGLEIRVGLNGAQQWELLADFAVLPPDTAYQETRESLDRLAQSHKGEWTGSQ